MSTITHPSSSGIFDASLITYNEPAPFVRKTSEMPPQITQLKKTPKAIGHMHPPSLDIRQEISNMDTTALLKLINQLNTDIEFYRRGKHKYRRSLTVHQEIGEDKALLALAKMYLNNQVSAEKPKKRKEKSYKKPTSTLSSVKSSAHLGSPSF